MEQDREDRVREPAEEWVEVEARVEEWVKGQAGAEAPALAREPEAVWDAEAVLLQAQEDTAFARNAEKRPFIRQELPATIRCVPGAGQP